MQKPHVLQWLALGGLQMLHVEQYLQQMHCSPKGETSSQLLLKMFRSTTPALLCVCMQGKMQ